MQSDSSQLLGGAGVSASTRHFVRHYLEMVVAMFLGMGVLIMPLGAALGLVGISLHDTDALMISGMAVTMTAPMVAWMRYRGHGWPACADMTAAMAIPTLGVVALLWSGLGGLGSLLVIEHVVMLPSMLVAMLLRRDEYTGAVHRERVAA